MEFKAIETGIPLNEELHTDNNTIPMFRFEDAMHSSAELWTAAM